MSETGKEPSPAEAGVGHHALKARRLGIDTHDEAVVFMRKECHVCRAEGFSAHTRIRLHHKGRTLIATLYQVTTEILSTGEMGLSDVAWHGLGLKGGEEISVSHPDTLESFRSIRGKVFGRRLDQEGLARIITDIVQGDYSDIHLSSFVTACATGPLDRDEMVALTRAMLKAGDRLKWKADSVVDKHCVGGLPGNRTTPIVVAIAAACGLFMPKTSSRAITSPAGTADTMETMAPVDLDVPAIRRVVEREGGCVVWGGAVRLSPADDILIRIERVLDLDAEGQLVASILSKKLAAGATRLIVDIPIGATAKVRSAEAAKALADSLTSVAAAFDLRTTSLFTDGSQPVGRGIGPALEARDVLSVLQGGESAPADLRERSLKLAGAVLELGGVAATGDGAARAARVLDSGEAWSKFQKICEAQGGMRTPPRSLCRQPIASASAGRLTAIDNRKLAKVAKLAGAPDAKAAGVDVHVRLGESIEIGQPLYTIHAETPGELAYAFEFAQTNDRVFELVER
jgi:thymidine phosphorylase